MTATSIKQQPTLLSTTIDINNEVPLPVVLVVSDPTLRVATTTTTTTTATMMDGYEILDRDGDDFRNSHDDDDNGDDTPSIASFTDSSSDDDDNGIQNINTAGWLMNDSSLPPLVLEGSSSLQQTYQIEFDSNLFDNNEYDDDNNEEQEFLVPVKGGDDNDDEEVDRSNMFGSRRRSRSLRGSFRAEGVRSGSSSVRRSSWSHFRHHRVVDDDDSLVRNRMGRPAVENRRPSWSDNILDIMGDDVDCIDVPMKNDD